MKGRLFRYPVLDFRVIDGDTVECIIDRGWNETKKLSCRIDGVDTPERRGKTALEKEAAAAVTVVVTSWCEVNEFDMISLEKGKYFGRCVGDLIPSGLNEGETTLSDFLISSGLARDYSGGKRKAWSARALKKVLQSAEMAMGGF
jgi:endonuclease YncB( thermonuclease family)